MFSGARGLGDFQRPRVADSRDQRGYNRGGGRDGVAGHCSRSLQVLQGSALANASQASQIIQILEQRMGNERLNGFSSRLPEAAAMVECRRCSSREHAAGRAASGNNRVYLARHDGRPRLHGRQPEFRQARIRARSPAAASRWIS